MKERYDVEVPADVGVIGVAIDDQLADLTAAMVSAIEAEIPELPRDRMTGVLLARSVESNLRTAAPLYRAELEFAGLAAPAEAREYARRLAQQGVSVMALVRAYRLGQYLHFRWCVDVLIREYADPSRALTAVRGLLQLHYVYVDTVSEQVIEEYQTERERWLSHRSTVRAEILQRILAGEAVEEHAAETALGIRLRRQHLGAVLWTASGHDTPGDLPQLESAATRLGQALGSPGTPVFWPKDRASAWVWYPLARGTTVDADVVAAALDRTAPPVHVALGAPAAGLTGFRHTHEDAMHAFRVATVDSGEPPAVVSYTDPAVRAAALLAADLPRTRRLVATSLGELAARTESAARLRATLLALLQERGSLAAAADRLHVHKNTVKYRVARAVEQRGRPLEDDRLELELALVATHWLGDAVLPEG
ncbi:helix-turn-helix domain-containing protein [Streptomyces sp. ISL-22]|uniref:helix-turn-helix domain-containing protein n=1 Tax=unclassified Streptomyces TaxID=2593676 RepID=UPI001BE7FFFE|nr:MULTISPECIES: helix-turn-helix domain-containing protein [unclassified Streptomyces]MBT2423775.1 helix-turn-helix domain-containing protein [Streptomyces sp. ISL-24]MBT2433495.1 helix-turn-helix domain-containing protein [Streptomyces sp. ISL-22]